MIPYSSKTLPKKVMLRPQQAKNRPLVQSLLLISLLFITACHSSNSELELATGWHADLLIEYDHTTPDMIVLSADNKLLYIACETKSDRHSPSLMRVDIATGHYDTILYGLQRADGLKMAPDGSLWLGEETSTGIVWHIRNPESLPTGQFIDRKTRISSHPDVRPLTVAGRFSHEGLAFSSDGQFCYLGDEWRQGSLYRLQLSNQQLSVMHPTQGWITIKKPLEARDQAQHVNGRVFERLEDMETLANGDVLLTETGAGKNPGRILLLKDKDNPVITTYLQDPRITHPDNLEWDALRNWLWITDDTKPSKLWAWDGKQLHLIASHATAEITGVTATSNGAVFINLQGSRFTSDATLQIKQISK